MTASDRTAPSAITRYFSAAALALLAFLVRLALIPVAGAGGPLILFFPVILISAWYFGLGPGLLTTALSAFLSWLLWQRWMLASEVFAELNSAIVIFSVVGFIIAWIVSRYRNALLRAEELRRVAETSERRLAAVLEGSLDNFYELDDNFRVTQINQQALRAFDLNAQAAQGADWRSLGALDAVTRTNIEKAVRQQAPVHFETRRHSPAGPLYWEVHAYPSAAGVSVFERDITQRTRAEERLRESEQNYFDLYENAPDMYCSVDAATGVVLQCNETLIRQTGFSREELVGRPVLEFYEEPSREKARSILDQCSQGSEIRDQELCLIRKNATPLDVSLSVTAVRDETGRVVRSRSVWRDISDRVRTRQELRRSEERFRQAILNAPIPIMILAEDGEVLHLSRAWTDLTGFRADELRTTADWTRRAFGERCDEVRQIIRESFAQPDAILNGWELPVRVASGQVLVWLFSSAPLGELPDGRKLQVMAAVDITAQKRTEHELRRTNAELEQFAYAASHDLQEPLRTISVFTQLLEERHGESLSPEAREHLRFVLQGADRMAALIRDLLAYSRLGGGEGLRLVPVDTNRVLEATRASMTAALADAGATLTAGDLPCVLGHEDSLQRLFQNLISNSLKYARPGVSPAIEVTAALVAAHWIFRFADNGIGIAPEHHEAIFGIFKRLHGVAVPGTGVGLALCRKIVEHCGGRIWVESRAGEGATFCFTLSSVDPPGSDGA